MIQKMLAEARERIVRLSPSEAQACGRLIVDTRSADERDRDGGFEARLETGQPVAAAPPAQAGIPGMGWPRVMTVRVDEHRCLAPGCQAPGVG